jgi:hypothetical protein
MGTCQWYGVVQYSEILDITIIEFLGIIHCPVFNLKHNVLETVFCLELQIKAYSVGPEDRDRIYCPKCLVLNKKQDTELLGFWTLSILRILMVTRKKKNKHDVSKTGSVSVLR